MDHECIKYETGFASVLQLACGKDNGANFAIRRASSFEQEIKELCYEAAIEYDLDNIPTAYVRQKGVIGDIYFISASKKEHFDSSKITNGIINIPISQLRSNSQRLRGAHIVALNSVDREDIALFEKLKFNKDCLRVQITSSKSVDTSQSDAFDLQIHKDSLQDLNAFRTECIQHFVIKKQTYYSAQQISLTIEYSCDFNKDENSLDVVINKLREERPVPPEALQHPAIKVSDPSDYLPKPHFGYTKETTLINNQIERLKNAINDREDYKEGIVLSGVPGTGKTSMAVALSRNSGLRVISIDVGAMMQNNIAELMKSLLLALDTLGAGIVILEEADSFMRIREQLPQYAQAASNMFLSFLDGPVDAKVQRLWIATTNHVNNIDPAYMRAGRFSMHIDMPLPSLATRKEAITYYVEKFSFNFSEHDIEVIAKISDSTTIKKLENIFCDASLAKDCSSSKVALIDVLEQITPPNLDDDQELFSAAQDQRKECVAYQIAGEIALRNSFDKNSKHYFASIKHLCYFGDNSLMMSNTYKSLERRAMCLLAGKAAESIHLGNDTLSQVLSSAHENELINLAKKATNSVMLSVQTINDELIQNSQPYKLELMFIHKMYSNVKALIEQNWSEVSAIADRLLQQDYLFNEDIKDCLRSGSRFSEFH